MFPTILQLSLMYKIQSIAIMILFLLVGLTGCRKTISTHTFHWPAVDSQYDSIAEIIEDAFLTFSQPDTLQYQIDKLDSLTKSSKVENRTILQNRTHFWRARYANLFGNRDQALAYLKGALLGTDSATRQYDWYRFTSELYKGNEVVTLTKQYCHYMDALTYAQSIGDKAYEAQIYIALGNILHMIGEYKKALAYYNSSDSLHIKLGFTKHLIKNQINIACTLNDMGCLKQGDSILRSIIGHPALEGDTFAQNLIPRNLYARDRSDTAYLYQAYRQIHDNPRFRYLRGLYRGLLAEYYIGEMEPDSARMYSDLSMEDLPFVQEHGHRAIIWYNRGQVYWEEGKADSALLARVEYEACIDSLHDHERKNEVIRLNALEEIRKREARYALSISRRNWVIAFVAVILIAAGVITILILNRRHMRQRMRSMANELELEKAKRKMAATAITIEEKDVMLDSLRSELSEMRKEGEIKEGSARRLEASIKTHLSGHEQEETFRDMFDTVNPGFTHRLRDICPDLADSYVRLACYTLMELDNKRIASLMNIRPESVRQSRWRLRKRLNIPEETSLEDFLRNLNNAR